MPLAPAIRCHLDAADHASLVVGEDVVLEPPARHLVVAPEGTLLDDLLEREDRAEITREALDRLAAWRREHDAGLTLDGVCLSWVWDYELFAEVFLPEVRTVAALLRVLRRSAVRDVELLGADPEVAACLSAALAAAGITVDVRGTDRLAPTYPGRLANPWRHPLAARVRHAAVRACGIPPMVRGNLLVLPYWHIFALHRRLLSEPGLVPLHDPFRVPPGSLRERLRMLAAGGWIGRPNALQVRRSRARVRRAVGTLGPLASDAADPLATLLDRRARRLLDQRAGETPALAGSVERALRRGRVRGVLVSFDSPPDARTVLAAARAAKRPSVVVQHGFYAEPNDPDKTEADVAAVWSERVRDELAPRRRGPIVVTGNPGVEGLRPRRVAPTDRTLILPEYPSRVSLWVDARVTMRLFEVILDGLSRARPGSVALLRPHPADHDLDAYAGLAARFPALRFEIDATSSITDVIARCDLCLSGVSTATLEAGMAGLPVVFVNVASVARPWPFDGEPGSLPMATDVEQLVAEIPRALARRGELPPAMVHEALGVLPGAQDRVLAALRDLTRDVRA